MTNGLPRGPFASLLAFSLLVAGCSLERYEGGGGFETPDLSARVVDTTGRPVFGARVWLVRSNGDSAPASVLDSMQTDSAGRVGFQLPEGANRSILGLDAEDDDQLGIAPAVFRSTSDAKLELRAARSIRADRDSTGAIPELHVPGSHFSSRTSGNGSSSILRVPVGIWDVAVTRGESLTVWRSLPVVADTTVSSPSAYIPTDTVAPKPLADSADIGLDSFRIAGVVQYADTSFHPSGDWLDAPYPSSAQTVYDQVGIRLNSNWVDSTGWQGSTFLRSPLLRDTGTLAIQIAFPEGVDTSLLCRMALFDSTNNAGMHANIGSDIDSIGVYSVLYGTSTSFVQTDAARFASDNTWYFSWTRDSVVIRTSNGIHGRAAILDKFSGPLRFTIDVRARKQPRFASMWIKKARVYKPR